jgi:hypothetical protein
MTKDQIPTERGVVFYVMGVAAGGLDIHARSDSTEGMASLVPTLDDICGEVVTQTEEKIPAGYLAIGTYLKTMITEEKPVVEIIENLSRLYREVPHSLE